VIFLAGLLGLAVALLAWGGRGRAPAALAAPAVLCPIGFAVSFSGMVVQSREQRRR
jgi:hypothetical protein